MLTIEKTCFSAQWLLGFLTQKRKDNKLLSISLSEGWASFDLLGGISADGAAVRTLPRIRIQRSVPAGSSLAAIWGSPGIGPPFVSSVNLQGWGETISFGFRYAIECIHLGKSLPFWSSSRKGRWITIPVLQLQELFNTAYNKFPQSHDNWEN